MYSWMRGRKLKRELVLAWTKNSILLSEIPKVVVCSSWLQPRHGICFVYTRMKGLVCLKGGRTLWLLTNAISKALGRLFISYSKLWGCLKKILLMCHDTRQVSDKDNTVPVCVSMQAWWRQLLAELVRWRREEAHATHCEREEKWNKVTTV